MKNKITLTLYLCLCASFMVSASWAGDIDLSVATNLSDPILVTPEGVTGEFSITLTNHGPDIAGANSPSSFPVFIIADPIFFEVHEEYSDYGYPIIFAKNGAIEQNCNFSIYQPSPIPGNPPQIDFVFRTPVINEGESVTCYGLYSAFFYDRERILDIGWSSNVIYDTDIDPSNDRAVLTFQAYNPPPQAVPSLSFYGLLLLIFATLFMVYKKQILLRKC